MRTLGARLGAGLALTCAALAIAAGSAAADPTSDYNNGLMLGTEAFQYGRPLLDMQRTFRTQTSTNVSDGKGDGPANQFNHGRRLTNASDRTVVAPNSDTLYSIAWVDVSRQPQVIHVPAIRNRFYVIPLYDMWTNNFYNITSVPKELPGGGQYNHTTGGDYAVVGRSFHGRLPRGVTRIVAPTTRIWIIGRTYIRDAADTKAVNRIQNQYTITRLSRFGLPVKHKRPKHPIRTKTNYTIPGTQPGEDPLDFYVALDRLLKTFPSTAADRSLIDRLKAIAVGPGLNPRTAGLSADTLRGMRDAVSGGDAKLRQYLTQQYVSGFAQHNGYLITKTGSYGTAYEYRALVDLIGIGALRSDVSIYPVAQTDRALAALTGAKRYVVHIPAGGLPPVKAFWSLTLYDSKGFFVPNPLNRYLINHRSDLHKNADGSIDLYLQAVRPSNRQQAQNWLPSPAGQPLRLIWRLYGPAGAMRGILDGGGYRLPAVQSCDATGHAADGTACAS